MATIKGKAIKWAISGVTFTAGIVSGTNGAEFQSIDLERTSDKAEVKSGIGDVVSQIFSNLGKNLSITVIPSAAGGASALATADTAVDAYNIAPGTTVTVADSLGTIVDGTNTGNYNVISSKQRRTNDGAVMIDLVLEAKDANDVTTTNS